MGEFCEIGQALGQGIVTPMAEKAAEDRHPFRHGFALNDRQEQHRDTETRRGDVITPGTVQFLAEARFDESFRLIVEIVIGRPDLVEVEAEIVSGLVHKLGQLVVDMGQFAFAGRERVGARDLHDRDQHPAACGDGMVIFLEEIGQHVFEVAGATEQRPDRTGENIIHTGIRNWRAEAARACARSRPR